MGDFMTYSRTNHLLCSHGWVGAQSLFPDFVSHMSGCSPQETGILQQDEITLVYRCVGGVSCLQSQWDALPVSCKWPRCTCLLCLGLCHLSRSKGNQILLSMGSLQSYMVPRQQPAHVDEGRTNKKKESFSMAWSSACCYSNNAWEFCGEIPNQHRE